MGINAILVLLLASEKRKPVAADVGDEKVSYSSKRVE